MRKMRPRRWSSAASHEDGSGERDAHGRSQPSSETGGVQPGGRYLPAIGAVDAIERVLAWVLSAVLILSGVAIVVLILVSVLSRYVFSHDIPTLEQLAGYFFVWMVGLGVPLCVRDGSLPAMHVLGSRLGIYEGTLRKAALVVALVFFVEFSITGWSVAQAAMAVVDPGSGLRLGYAYAGMFVGAAFASIFIVGQLARQRWRRVDVLACVGVIGVVAVFVILNSQGVFSDDSLIIPIALVVAVCCVVIGVPVAAALGLGAFAAADAALFLTPDVVAQRMADALNNFVLLAIPLFLLAGHLMARTSLASRLVRVATAVLGSMRGGLGVSNVGVSVLFADISGSAIADTAAIGTVMIPELRERGYTRERAAAMQAAAGTLGIMFPPSVTMIIYAWVANVSVIHAFLSVVIPGIVLAFAYIVLNSLYARRTKIDKGIRTSGRDRLVALIRGIPPMVLPVVILGSVFTGIATTAEAGALGVLATFLVTAGYRETSVRKLGEVAVSAAMAVSRVGLVIASATALAWVMTSFNGAQKIVKTLTSLTDRPALVLVLVAIGLLFLHLFMDASATMLVVTPLLAPTLLAMQISLLQFGVVLDITSAAGLIIPPLGFNLYIASQISGVNISQCARAAVPFVLVTLVVTLVVILVPVISTYLPSLLHGG